MSDLIESRTVYHHGTTDDFQGFDPNFDHAAVEVVRDYEVPEGVVFLTDCPETAACYGRRVVSAHVVAEKILKIDAGSASPDRFFDDDYNGDAAMWQEFLDGDYDAIEIIGAGRYGRRRTVVTYPDRIELYRR